MKVFYYLPACSTCRRILEQLNLSSEYQIRDIKKNPLTEPELDKLSALAGSYEALFSKRSMMYKKLNLSQQNLKEEDFKRYILEHYTFLKRPVLVSANTIFIGNAPKTISEAQEFLLKEQQLI